MSAKPPPRHSSPHHDVASSTPLNLLNVLQIQRGSRTHCEAAAFRSACMLQFSPLKAYRKTRFNQKRPRQGSNTPKAPRPGLHLSGHSYRKNDPRRYLGLCTSWKGGLLGHKTGNRVSTVGFEACALLEISSHSDFALPQTSAQHQLLHDRLPRPLALFSVHTKENKKKRRERVQFTQKISRCWLRHRASQARKNRKTNAYKPP